MGKLLYTNVKNRNDHTSLLKNKIN